MLRSVSPGCTAYSVDASGGEGGVAPATTLDGAADGEGAALTEGAACGVGTTMAGRPLLPLGLASGPPCRLPSDSPIAAPTIATITTTTTAHTQKRLGLGEGSGSG